MVENATWLAARRALLEKEKELTRLNDALAAERRRLPWVKVEKDYRFDTPDGVRNLGDIFDGRTQLIGFRKTRANQRPQA